MTKTHFFVLRRKEGRASFLTLPAQTLGRDGKPVTSGIIVKPRKGVEALFRKFRKDSPDDTVFYTRSLKREYGCYSAGDINPVSDLYRKESSADSDTARTEWESYKSTNFKK